jgi:hypothetical protein
MTSLEGVPRTAVMSVDLREGVAGGGRGMPLVTLANGTLIKTSLLPESLPRG